MVNWPEAFFVLQLMVVSCRFIRPACALHMFLNLLHMYFLTPPPDEFALWAPEFVAQSVEVFFQECVV